MKTKAFLILATLTLTLALILPTQSYGKSNGFIIIGADDSSDYSMTSSPTLIGLVTTVASHFVMGFADTNHEYSLESVPVELHNLLNLVTNHISLIAADKNHLYYFQYATELIGDTAPPTISAFQANSSGESSVTITWSTNEYTTSVVEYGTESGNYLTTINIDLYYKSHTVVLTDLVQGQTYFLRLTDTDRSGNSTQSVEYSFAATNSLYLPIVIR